MAGKASLQRRTPCYAAVTGYSQLYFNIIRAVINGTELKSLYLEITIIVVLNPSNPFTLTSFIYLETPFLDYVFNLT